MEYYLFKKTKPPKENTICDHLLIAIIPRLFEEFTILPNGNNIFFLEIKGSLLIKRDGSI